MHFSFTMKTVNILCFKDIIFLFLLSTAYASENSTTLASRIINDYEMIKDNVDISTFHVQIPIEQFVE